VDRSFIEYNTLPRENFDVIFHVDLLSHFADPALALRRMSDLLASDGVLCFEVGLFGGMRRWWYDHMGRPGFPQHLWFYSFEALERLLAQANLKIIEVQRFNVSLSALLSSALLRLAPEPLRQRPREASGASAPANLKWEIYEQTHFWLRYRLGAHLPAFGPSTALVAAAPHQPR
jgi:SAM-dependent methyltransferase